MSTRWTQFESDSYRLPHGFTRVAYDADSKRYTFRDRKDGRLYVGKPGEEYGVMTVVQPPKDNYPSQLRRADTAGASSGPPPPRTFEEILSGNQITKAEAIDPAKRKSPIHVPNVQMPKAPSVSAALKRSKTSATSYLSRRKTKRTASTSEYKELDNDKGLLRDDYDTKEDYDIKEGYEII